MPGLADIQLLPQCGVAMPPHACHGIAFPPLGFLWCANWLLLYGPAAQPRTGHAVTAAAPHAMAAWDVRSILAGGDAAQAGWLGTEVSGTIVQTGIGAMLALLLTCWQSQWLKLRLLGHFCCNQDEPLFGCRAAICAEARKPLPCYYSATCKR